MRVTVRVGLVATLIGALMPLVVGSTARAATASDVIDADAGTVLPFSNLSDMATDHVRDLAYVDGASDFQPGHGKVVVLDGTGTLTNTFAGLTSPSGMALSADGTTLYVASVTGDEQAIVSVDVATGRQHTYPLGDQAYRAIDVAVVDGHVWFTRNEPPPSEGGQLGLGVLDPASGVVHHPAVLGTSSVYQLASAPSVAHTLFVESDQGFSRLAVVFDDVSEPVVTVVAHRDHSFFGNLEISPDGTQLLVGGGGHAYRTSDFASVDVYRGRQLPEYERVAQDAIAERADGTIAVAGSNDFDAYLSVYRPDHTVFAEQSEYHAGDSLGVTDGSVSIDDEELAFGATTLFTVTTVERPPDTVNVVHVSRPDPPADPIGTSTIALPSTLIGEIVSDPPHSQAFVNVTDGVLVVDDRGIVRRVVQHLPGITQMTRSGDTLWMSLADGDSLAAMDTRTYAVRKYFVGTDSEPAAVAVAAGDVWFSHRQTESYEVQEPSTLGALDPASGRVCPRVATGFFAVQLRASALHPHSIYGTAYELPFGDFKGIPEIRIKITGGLRPTATVEAASDVGAGLLDAVETPDALHLDYANDDDYDRTQPWRALAAQSLAHAGEASTYPATVAVAARSDGLIASGSQLENSTDAFPVVVRQGAFGPTRLRIYREGGQKFTVLDRGLAFASDDLYAIVHQYGVVDPRVVVLPMPARQKLSLTTDQDYYRRGDTVRLVAHVEPRLLAQHPEISIEARPDDGTTRDVELAQRPDAAGNVTVSFPFARPVSFYAQVRYGAAEAKALPLHRTTPPR